MEELITAPPVGMSDHSPLPKPGLQWESPAPSTAGGRMLRNVKRTAGPALVLALCVTVGQQVSSVAAVPGAPESPSVATSTPPTPTEETALQVRAMYGFSTDLALVRRLAAGSERSARRLEAPLTLAEAAEYDRRHTLGTVGAEVGQALGVEDPGYAGSWLTTRTGELHVAFTRLLAADEAARLRARFPRGSTVIIDEVKVSQNALVRAQQAANSETAAEAGLTVLATAVLEQQNTVEVAVPADQSLEAASRLFASLFPELSHATTFVVADHPEDDYSRDTNTGKAYGGLWMSLRIGGELTGGCSVGMSAMQDKTQPDLFYIATAGHCGFRSDQAYLGRSTTSAPLGDVFNSTDRGTGTQTNCDCLIIGPLSRNFIRLTSEVLVDNNAPWRYTRVGGAGDLYGGQGACLTGAYSFELHQRITCGVITSGSTTKTTERGTKLVDLVSLDGDLSGGGDSGGAWGQGNAWLGVNQGTLHLPATNFTRTYFSKGANFESALNSRARFDLGL